ncbi:type I restriction-modification system subunit S [Streptomyces olivaceoviridis]|uniref:restriction endonuclease subunit S n=1 Tax=Streptomyces olivaceoviridis TaxID=1921 RepID=UPI0016779566|nr:restriction endonuclease subunit S [Streptomyces olivaceoviridis]GGY70233.1 type I restriction-modification system subunit S [Streptomyces olivaceoviridis]
MSDLVLGESLELLVDNRGKNPPFVPSGIPVLSAKSIKNGRISFREVRYISEDTYTRWMPKPLQRFDVILTSEAPLGECALVTGDEPLAIAQRLYALRGKPGVLDSRYLYYAMQWEAVQTDLHNRASGTTVSGIRQPELLKVRIPDPGYTQQKAIAAVLGALDDKITVNERISVTYERLLQCRYIELGLAEEANAEAAVPVTDLVAFNPKVAKPSADEPVYVDMAALQVDRASIASWTRRAPKSGPRFMNGDTLLARITPCLENGKTGYVDFMEDGEVGLGSTEFIVMRSLPGVPGELSYFLARDSRFREHAIRNMAGTSGRQRVSAADAAHYQVNRPDADALAAFGKEASAAFSHMKSLQAENRTLAALRDTLLPPLMSGRLRVRDAERIAEDAT